MNNWLSLKTEKSNNYFFCMLGLRPQALEHMWWHCPAWVSVRHHDMIATPAYSVGWPECLRKCGIMPARLDGLSSALAYCSVNVSDSDAVEEDFLDLNDWDASLSLWNGRFEVVFTDEACSNNQDARFRRAGYDIFWSTDDCRNVSARLLGHLQSNQRAELFAVYSALAQNLGEYVFDGCVTNRHAWRFIGWRIDNKDLWVSVDNLLQQRQPASIKFTKAKSHAKFCDVETSLSTHIDR